MYNFFFFRKNFGFTLLRKVKKAGSEFMNKVNTIIILITF